MNSQILKYRIIVGKETEEHGEEIFIAYAPSLGISDFGQTIDKAISNMEKAIKLYVETLIDLRQPVPEQDADEYIVTTRNIKVNTPDHHVM